MIDKFELEESISGFISVHEVILTNKTHKRDANINVNFSRWGILLLVKH